MTDLRRFADAHVHAIDWLPAGIGEMIKLLEFYKLTDSTIAGRETIGVIVFFSQEHICAVVEQQAHLLQTVNGGIGSPSIFAISPCRHRR